VGNERCMKQEILRRQDIFKSFLEKELYNNSAVEMYQEDIKSIVENVMTLYRADIEKVIELLKEL